MSAYVNLWELITTVARSKHDLPNGERCKAIEEACGRNRSFATELSLEVDDRGRWTVTLFHHEDPHGDTVELTVEPDGLVGVTRIRNSLAGICDRRTIAF